jgi:hypothetical protein
MLADVDGVASRSNAEIIRRQEETGGQNLTLGATQYYAAKRNKTGNHKGKASAKEAVLFGKKNQKTFGSLVSAADMTGTY